MNRNPPASDPLALTTSLSGDTQANGLAGAQCHQEDRALWAYARVTPRPLGWRGSKAAIYQVKRGRASRSGPGTDTAPSSLQQLPQLEGPPGLHMVAPSPFVTG